MLDLSGLEERENYTFSFNTRTAPILHLFWGCDLCQVMESFRRWAAGPSRVAACSRVVYAGASLSWKKEEEGTS